MDFSVSEITTEQRDRLLVIEEGHFHEVKSRQVAPSKLTRTISAFANASGGELYVGIEEERLSGIKKRSWDGFSDIEAANGHIQAFVDLFPLGRYFSYTFLRCTGEKGLVMQVNIHKTREITKASNGIPYVRQGAQNTPVETPEELRRLELDKGITSFESDTINIDPRLVTNSSVVIGFILDVIPTAEPAEWLTKQLLICDGKPTVACILLFCEEPQAVLPKHSGIKIYRYKTTDAEGQRSTLAFDPMSIEGCIYDQIKSAVRKTVELIEDIHILGPGGFEKVKYPPETLHEIITNAVLHRDYSLASDIHVRIFDNRIEVESPGRLPGHITPDNILEEQCARNGSIVRIINKFPDAPNKDVGEGLNTAFAAMRQMRLKNPLIKEGENSVIVQIRHERLASPEDGVMEYLESHAEINNRTARHLTGIQSENSMKDVFYRLRDRALIERVPGKEGPVAAWRKTDRAIQESFSEGSGRRTVLPD
jgi:ATP-dependent DNA helicase RecG